MADLAPETRDAVREGCISSARHAWPTIIERVVGVLDRGIESVLDVGTGEGHWLDAAQEWMHGVQCYGVDLPSAIGVETPTRGFWDAESPSSLPMVDKHGARTGSVDSARGAPHRWDVALCLEVAEHVDAKHAKHLIRELCRVSRAVVWSAAIPGQGGDGHVNEQPPSYWNMLFEQRGWTLTDPFRETLWGWSVIEPWYQQNLLLGVPFLTLSEEEQPAARHLVHPAVLEAARDNAAYWREEALAQARRADDLLGAQ
jgi:hypothetical protein